MSNASRHRVLFVEDDRTIRTALTDALHGEGHEVIAAADGHEAEALLKQQRFDLCVLDVMLPGPSGLELLKGLRQRDDDTPVLLLTARGEEGDKVLGLELGADDYVTKPFSLRELLARVKAMLRRRGREEATASAFVEQFALGDVRIDLASFTLVRDGKEHALSPKEAAMLKLLRQRHGRAVSRADFLQDVWGGGYVGDRTIDTHVLNLRQKLERDHKQPQYLLTVHGVGYRLLDRPDADEA
ncbi:MAG: response regulator transcription factor [Planctomycetota bacterium]